jgi:hypothetical protein
LPEKEHVPWDKLSLTASFLFGGAIGIPLGLALSQPAPQRRVQVHLQRGATDKPMPANLEVRDDRWDLGAETGQHDHPGSGHPSGRRW